MTRPACICDFPDNCGGLGVVDCSGCGGDQCVCAACNGQGRQECEGCGECEDTYDQAECDR